MFKSDYTIYGKHATYVKYLVNDVKAFERYIDVYMAGAAMGALYGKRSEEGDSADRARVYADAFNTEYVKCNELFKTVILSDTTMPWSVEEKINICFRYRDKIDEHVVPPVSPEEIAVMKEALKLFHSYVRGGIEILYESFSNNASVGTDEIIDYAYKSVFDQHALIENGQGKLDTEQLLRSEY